MLRWIVGVISLWSSLAASEVLRMEVRGIDRSKNTMEVRFPEGTLLKIGDTLHSGLQCKMTVRQVRGRAGLLSIADCPDRATLTARNRITVDIERRSADQSLWVNKVGFRAGLALGLNSYMLSGSTRNFSRSVLGITVDYLDAGLDRPSYIANGTLGLIEGTSNMAAYFGGGRLWPLSPRSYATAQGHVQLFLAGTLGDDIGLGAGGSYGYYIDRYVVIEGIGRMTFVGLDTDTIEFSFLAHASYFFP
jgi:hypothetical protein